MGFTLFTCKAEVVEGMVPKLSLPQNLEMFKCVISENKLLLEYALIFLKKLFGHQNATYFPSDKASTVSPSRISRYSSVQSIPSPYRFRSRAVTDTF